MGKCSAGAFTLNGLDWTIDYGLKNETEITLTFNGIAFPETSAGVLVLTSQNLTTTPPGGTLTNPGTIDLQGTTSLTITGNVVNLGNINTGNAVNDPGHNSLAISGNLTNNGNIALNASGDSMTTGNLTTSGSLLVGNGDMPERSPAVAVRNVKVSPGEGVNPKSKVTPPSSDALPMTLSRPA